MFFQALLIGGYLSVRQHNSMIVCDSLILSLIAKSQLF